MAGELRPSHHLLIWTNRLDLFAITALPGTVCIYRVVFNQCRYYCSVLRVVVLAASYTHAESTLQTRSSSLVVRA